MAKRLGGFNHFNLSTAMQALAEKASAGEAFDLLGIIVSKSLLKPSWSRNLAVGGGARGKLCRGLPAIRYGRPVWTSAPSDPSARGQARAVVVNAGQATELLHRNSSLRHCPGHLVAAVF